MINKQKSFVSAVIYVHNNEDNISDFLRTVYGVFSKNFERSEIICVNDASSDRSVNFIKETSEDFVNCSTSIVHMSFFQGVEKSMNAGVDIAIGDYVFEFDSCIQDYNDDLIMDVFNKSLEGYDIVAAKPKKKKIPSLLFYKLYNSLSNSPQSISTEVFKLISRRAINRINVLSKTVPYRKAVYANSGLSFFSVEYSPDGSKKDNRRTRGRINVALSVLILFTDVAYKIATILSVAMILATVATAIYAVIVYISQNPVPGFTPLILVMTLSFSAVFAIFAIIIKYLSIITDLVFINLNYVVGDVEKVK